MLAKVKQSGQQIISSGQIADKTGKATFDALAVSKAFAKDHDGFLTQFVQVLADADRAYTSQKASWTAESPQVKAVAKWSGAEAASVPASLALYAFVPPAEQAGKAWLGGGKDSGVARSLAATAAFLKEQGTIQTVLPDYSVGLNPSWVQRAK